MIAYHDNDDPNDDSNDDRCSIAVTMLAAEGRSSNGWSRGDLLEYYWEGIRSSVLPIRLEVTLL